MDSAVSRRTFMLACSIGMLGAASLSGCNNASTEESDSPASEQAVSEVITPLSLVNDDGRRLFFVVDKVAKDAQAQLYVFESGVMTFRSNVTAELGELSKMSDDEIVELFTEEDEKYKSEYHDYSNPYYLFEGNPTLQTVELETDDSGNNVTSETLVFGDFEKYQIVNDGDVVDMNGSAWSDGWQLKLFGVVETAPIYETYYGGFNMNNSADNGCFVMRVDSPDSVEFSFDEVGTEGTETV